MTAGWGCAFVLKINMGGGLQCFFQPGCTDQWRGSVELVGIPHLLRDGNIALMGGFLFNQRHGEKR